MSNVMQTYNEKVSILYNAVNLDEVEIFTGGSWDSVKEWPQYILNEYYQIRVKPKTLTRTITTPVPVTLEWARANPLLNVFGVLGNGYPSSSMNVSSNALESGLFFHTAEDAAAALKAFTESMK